MIVKKIVNDLDVSVSFQRWNQIINQNIKRHKMLRIYCYFTSYIYIYIYTRYPAHKKIPGDDSL